MIEERQCPQCHGTGLVHADNGITFMQEKCERCDGYGTIECPTGNEKLTREELNYENKNK